MVMVVPVDGNIKEAQHIAEKDRRQFAQRDPVGLTRGRNSKTIIVMMIAMTPSLKAVSRSFSISPSSCGVRANLRIVALPAQCG